MPKSSSELSTTRSPASAMPGRHYDDAFAMLEKSFNDSSFMKAYQALPVKKEDSRVAPRPPMRYHASATTNDSNTTTTGEDDADDYDGASDSSADMHEGFGSKLTPPLAISRNNLSLPPTPPTQSREVSGATAHPGSLTQEGNSRSSSHSRSRLSTPVHQQRPPTPDLTPPSTRDRRLRGLQPPRPPMPQAASSRAESFVTAREDANMSSARTSSLSLPLSESSAGRNWLDATRNMRLGAIEMRGTNHIGQEEEEEADGDSTPTKEKSYASLQERGSTNTLRKRESFQKSYRVSDDDSEAGNNSNLLRNVTIRKKRRKPDLHDAGARIHNGQPLREQNSALHEQEFLQPTRKHSGQHVGEYEWSAMEQSGNSHIAVNDLLYRAIRDEKSRRLSGMSQTSTTVEAVVIPGPQQRKRTLRHAGKNLALREGMPATRYSLESATANAHARSPSLRHRKAPLPGRRELLKEEARDAARSVSNPERKRADRVQVIVIPERRTSLADTLPSPRLRRHEKMHLLTVQQHHTLHHSKPNASLLHAAIDPDAGSRAFEKQDSDMLDQHRQLHTPPAQGLYKGSTSSRLRHVSAPLPQSRSPRSSYREGYQEANASSHRADLSPRLGWNRHSSTDVDLVSPLSEHAPSSSSSISPLPSPSPTADHLSLGRSSSPDYHTANNTVHSTPAKSRDTAGPIGLFDYDPASPRPSIDNSHANARHALSAQTPGSMSQFSDHTVECEEAQAVSLYPHHNDSLLLVHNSAANPRRHVRPIDTKDARKPPSVVEEVPTPTSTSSSRDTTRGEERGTTEGLRPIFNATVEEPMPTTSADDFQPFPTRVHENGEVNHEVNCGNPGNDGSMDKSMNESIYENSMNNNSSTNRTGPNEIGTNNTSTNNKDKSNFLDSPLTNPRPAPMPPVFIIPPTPSPRPHLPHSTSSELGASRLSRPAPQRRQSLVEKARRYSESLLQPFVPVRSASMSSNKRHSTGSDRSRPMSASERTQTLHPFWRPRGFWDDFSSSESEDDYPYDDEEDRLPAGGDTSDVESLKQKRAWPRKMSVRMSGFRGQGGFLVGNSLGIERWGSNRRRHYVFAPSASLASSSTSSPPGSSGSGKVRRGRGARDADVDVDVKNSTHRRALSLPFFTANPTSSRPPAGLLRKKRSGDLLRDFTYSTESLRQRALKQRRGAGGKWMMGALGGLGGYRIRGVGVREIRERMGQKWLEREERRRERRRRELKGMISRPVESNGGGGGGGGGDE